LGPRLVPVGDPDDPRLDDYRHLRDGHRGPGDAPLTAEGVLVVRQLLRSHYPVRSLLLAPHKVADLEADLERLDPATPVYVAPAGVTSAIAGFPFHRGALASADRLPLPPAAELLAGARLVVVLEGINDHENLGALFRNAAAFGADAILCCPRCADPLYRRSIRVSMGHVLHLPFARLEPWPGALAAVADAGLRLVALTPTGPGTLPVDRLTPAAGPVALMVGAEGGGLSRAALAAAELRVRIPMATDVDSLNVATAAAVALHRLSPAR
jgi:tRNA G18 (ribose-2'-O)-methylase SpoU